MIVRIFLVEFIGRVRQNDGVGWIGVDEMSRVELRALVAPRTLLYLRGDHLGFSLLDQELVLSSFLLSDEGFSSSLIFPILLPLSFKLSISFS